MRPPDLASYPYSLQIWLLIPTPYWSGALLIWRMAPYLCAALLTTSRQAPRLYTLWSGIPKLLPTTKTQHMNSNKRFIFCSRLITTTTCLMFTTTCLILTTPYLTCCFRRIARSSTPSATYSCSWVLLVPEYGLLLIKRIAIQRIAIQRIAIQRIAIQRIAYNIARSSTPSATYSSSSTRRGVATVSLWRRLTWSCATNSKTALR